MSNVGVRIGGEQNSGPKGSEVSEAESNAFKGFDGSMSNVGARISCEQNPGSKGSEVSEAESNAL